MLLISILLRKTEIVTNRMVASPCHVQTTQFCLRKVGCFLHGHRFSAFFVRRSPRNMKDVCERVVKPISRTTKTLIPYQYVCLLAILAKRTTTRGFILSTHPYIFINHTFIHKKEYPLLSTSNNTEQLVRPQSFASWSLNTLQMSEQQGCTKKCSIPGHL